VRSNIDSEAEVVVDARGPGRFAGTEAEPRPGIRSGHIPKSLNVPFPSVRHACFKYLHWSSHVGFPV
jgi:thiosulfate/3-mercaptopyruvate sulfurtransferase